MTHTDWQYRPNSDTWFNPESGVIIADEDMPWELKPDNN